MLPPGERAEVPRQALISTRPERSRVVRLHRTRDCVYAAAILLGFGLCGAALADDITVRPGAAPVLPDTSVGDTVVLRGTQPAKTAPSAPAALFAAEELMPRSRPWAPPICFPGFDCSGENRDFDWSGLSSETPH